MFKQGELLNGTYRIIENIGSGGGGEIYKAYHTHLKCNVAVKLIKENIKGKLDDRAEADILKKIKHSYLPQVFDFVETDNGDIYTVMEFIEGSSFQELINNGRKFTQQQVLKYAKQICEALAYLHTRKPAIVHSDIKPANIMLTPEDNICIIDFNISSALSDGGAFAVGKSDGYSPPEQYVKKKNNGAYQVGADQTEFIENTEIIAESDITTVMADETEVITDTDVSESAKSDGFVSKLMVSRAIINESSDVYAVGATLYCLISGRRPEKSIDKVTPITRLDVTASYGLKHIISKAMEVSQKKRYANAGEMLEALKDIHCIEKLYRSFVVRNRIVYSLLIFGTALFSVIAFMGYEKIGIEKAVTYNEYAERLVVLRESGDVDDFEQIYSAAEEIYQDRLDIHFQKALFLFERAEYDECIEYIDEILADHPEYNDDAEMADLLFVNANCFFEKEDYISAILKYKAAIYKNSENGEYYRDYAISLARTGELEKAADALNQATRLGLSEENICLVEGEIEFVRGRYDKAEVALLKCIDISSDDYIKQRAYILCGSVYNQSGKLTENVQLMERALEDLPEERLYGIYEILAQCYLDIGKETGSVDYYLKAIDVFSIMQKKGIGGYRVSESKAVAFYTIGDCESAKAEFENMKNDFGENYRISMYLAYVELLEESRKSNNNRDYSDFLRHYNDAEKLYKEQLKEGTTDIEMQVLEDAYLQLRDGNWF